MKATPFGDTRYDDWPPIPVRFPLTGVWIAANTPGRRIPSHGTDRLGQRFAYDFVHAEDMRLARAFWTGLRYWFGGGVPLSRARGLGAVIHAPLPGKVVATKDGWPDRTQASPLDVFGASTLGMRISEQRLRSDYRIAAGNYLIVEAADCFVFLAHAMKNSLRVAEGESVQAGQPLAKVGHTGNSTAPHLHCQLMDGPDLWTAKGLPCCLAAYEQLVDGVWQPRENTIPGDKDVIRPIAD